MSSVPSAPATFFSNPFPLSDPLICSDDTVSRGSTLAAGLNLARGAVVQYDPATKTVKSPPAAGTANAILAVDCNATAGATPCVIYVGGIFRYTGMAFNTANDAINVQIESLRSHGIQVESVQDITGQRQPAAGVMMAEQPVSVEKAKQDLAEAKAKQAIADAKVKAADAADAQAKADAEEAKKAVDAAEKELKEAEAAAKAEADKKAADAKHAESKHAAPPATAPPMSGHAPHK